MYIRITYFTMNNLTIDTNSEIDEICTSKIDKKYSYSIEQHTTKSLTNLDEDLEKSSKVITLENNFETTQKVEKKNYSKMRIDDLRTLVVTKNLLDNDSAQKMKKNDLVKLLHA